MEKRSLWKKKGMSDGEKKKVLREISKGQTSRHDTRSEDISEHIKQTRIQIDDFKTRLSDSSESHSNLKKEYILIKENVGKVGKSSQPTPESINQTIQLGKEFAKLKKDYPWLEEKE